VNKDHDATGQLAEPAPAEDDAPAQLVDGTPPEPAQSEPSSSAPAPFVSYAQNQEDVLLFRALRQVRAGFYIDVGAAHPEELSVTKAFYDRGWHGIDIEPAPDYAVQLRQARPRDLTLQVALGAAPGAALLQHIVGTGLSTLDTATAARHAHAGFVAQTMPVVVTTLAEVCRAHAAAEIHFLKIDAEGAEREILLGADFVAFRPWIVVVEATAPMTTTLNYQAWEGLLLQAGYSFVWFDGLNRFYLAAERQSALAASFTAPPNCFDAYVRAGEVAWSARATAAEQALADSTAAYAAAETRASQAAELAAVASRQAAAAQARAGAAERAAAHADARAVDANARAVTAEAQSAEATARMRKAETRGAEAEARAQQAAAAMAEAQAQAAAAWRQMQALAAQAEALRAAAIAGVAAARAEIAALHASTSWRLTGPLRMLSALAQGRLGLALISAGVSRARLERVKQVGGRDGSRAKRAGRIALHVLARIAARAPGARLGAAVLRLLLPGPWRWLQRRTQAYLATARAAAAAQVPPILALPALPLASLTPALPAADAPVSARSAAAVFAQAGRRLRTVHQFHSGSATGDAVTNSMLLMRGWLRAQGYASDIFVEHLDPRLATELLEIGDLPSHGDYVLIVHHSMGHDALARIIALPARKVLMYHNITPPEFLQDAPFFIPYAELGRRQLAELRPHMLAALADSEVNALELRADGYDAPAVCTFLFDIDLLLARAEAHVRARAQRPADAPFTVLFVGRVAGSKGQADLVDAFAAFRRQWAAPCRLVLVGHLGGSDAAYPAEIRRRIALHGLQQQATLTGPVSDAELHGWYGAADLYVSLSHHEGFGVPLIEAMAHDVPVLAWPAAAVPFTMGGAGELLTERTPTAVAAAMLRLARDPARRARMVAQQHQTLERFRLTRQGPTLLAALLAAGAAPPPEPQLRERLAAHLRFAVTGHVNGSYSLATMNRTMALALEARHPAMVRLQPVETLPTRDLSRVPTAHARGVATLVARPRPPSGPEVVISHHYPVHVPPERGDVTIAMMAWEESLLPEATVAVLNGAFDMVFAMSGFVTKALCDSGVGRPLRSVGNVVELDGFFRLGDAREAAGAAAGGAAICRFLHVSSCFPRKGVDVLLAAYARAFRAGDPVRLVIKGFPNPHNDVAEQIARLRAADPAVAEIVLIDRDLDEAGLLDLYRDADAVVLPTRGEGFNLPAAEAMAAGLPLIVTGFGGQLDFCTAAEARLIDFRFAESGSHVAGPGSVWVEPDMADLAAALRELCHDITGAGGASLARAARARAAVRERLDPQRCLDRLTGCALEALTAPPPPPLRVAWLSTWDVRCGIAAYSGFLVEQLLRQATAPIGALTVLCDVRTPASPAGAGLPVRPSWRLNDADSINGLVRSVAAEDPDVLVIQHQPGLIHWPDLARLLTDRRVHDRVTLVTLHTPARLLDITDPAERAAVLAALARCSRVLVHRIEDLNLLKRLGLVDNVTLFPHGASPRYPAPPARALAAQQAPVIASHGFFLPGKGLPRLIEAAALLRRDWPRLRLRLVNAEYTHASDAEIARCRALADRLGLREAIEWDTGFHPPDEILRRLGGCDLVVLPYDESKESASGALRVALASGVPVAVSPAAIFAEAGEAVHRFERIDVAATAAGIDRLLRDQALRQRCQDSAAAWLAARRWDVLARRLGGMMAGLRAAGPAAAGGSDDR
jgi:FkbM family methyltransferase